MIYRSECPLGIVSLCSWTSDPMTTEAAAREALRAHVSEHRHGDLVEFCAAHASPITRYAQVPVNG